MPTFSVDAAAQQHALLEYFAAHPEEAPASGVYTVVVQADSAGAESSPIQVSLP